MSLCFTTTWRTELPCSPAPSPPSRSAGVAPSWDRRLTFDGGHPSLVAGLVPSYDGFMSPVVVRRTAWRASLEGHNVLIRLLERELQQDVGISLGWYDVLVHLAEAPKGKLRMNELADSLVLSRSWLTRRIDGMERAAIVHRCRSSVTSRTSSPAARPRSSRRASIGSPLWPAKLSAPPERRPGGRPGAPGPT